MLYAPYSSSSVATEQGGCLDVWLSDEDEIEFRRLRYAPASFESSTCISAISVFQIILANKRRDTSPRMEPEASTMVAEH